ncbi:MAG: GNAT family N-acetyltransferase [Gammaproteobacteria bacterium]|nr:GNAT family N-acetyltransferase [Gammaproteobacteria bacterium]
MKVAEANMDDVPQAVELLFHLDAHVSGAPRDLLKMTPQGEKELATRLRSYIDNPYKLLLVARHSKAGVVGMGDIALWKHAEVWETPERQGQWYGVIDDVWVEPDYRRQGLSRRIVRGLVAFAHEHGVESLQLEYSASNQEAARTWKKLGFRPIGIRAAASASEVLTLLADEQQES